MRKNHVGVKIDESGRRSEEELTRQKILVIGIVGLQEDD